MSQLVFWNESPYADSLAAFFDKNNMVTNAAQYADALTNWKQYSSIIMLCELNWGDEETKLRYFKGIDLVKEMRMDHNMDLPVLFVSFYPLKNLFNVQTEILTAVGHSFCQLPAPPGVFIDKLRDERKLSPVELKDVQLFSCNPRGIVLEKMHKLQGTVGGMDGQNINLIRRLMESCITEVHSVFKVDADAALDRFRREFHNLGKDHINAAVRYIDDVSRELIENYAPLAANVKADATAPKPWKLLLLDDELTAESELVRLLEQKGVRVICTSNAGDASRALVEDNDLRGKISLILSDFRLYYNEDGVPVQQRKQGYAFLQDVAEKFQGRLMSAVVYSGMPRRFLLDTFRTFKMRTEVYSKMDFKLNDAGAMNFLVNRLIEIGNENYEAMAMLPLASRGWAEHLHETYLVYRQQRDYEKRENDICEYCTDWVKKFTSGQNPPTPMIKGDAFRPGRNKSDKDTLERFEAYYKTRRLAQFLNIYYESRGSGDPADMIPKLLAPKGKKMDSDAAKRGFFSQIIGFKREEFPFSATIEELCWFEYDLGIKVLDNYKRFRNKLNECEYAVGEFIQEVKILKKALEDIDYRYVDIRKHELIFDKDTCKPYLFDKTDLSLCLQWLNMQKENLNGQSMRAIIELIDSIELLWK